MPRPLNNFEIQKYSEIEPRFNFIYSRDYLAKTNDGAYVVKQLEFIVGEW